MNNYASIRQIGLPPRPTLPLIAKPVPVPQLIAEAFKAAPGIVLGESHIQMASFRVLFDNAETLKDQGVKTVYFEGVIDMPQGLVDDGIGLLAGTDKKPRTNPTFQELRAKLEHNGIQIMPIDHYYLTRHKDLRGILGPTTTGNGSVRRLEEFNYYAAETIQAHSGTQKWVALVGRSHMNTSEGVPGLAELTGAIGIGVFDRRNVQTSIGRRVIGRAPDPTQPIAADSVPGDLQIYVKPQT